MVRQVHKTNPTNSRIFITLFFGGRLPFGWQTKGRRAQEVWRGWMGISKKKEEKQAIYQWSCPRTCVQDAFKKAIPSARAAFLHSVRWPNELDFRCSACANATPPYQSPNAVVIVRYIIYLSTAGKIKVVSLRVLELLSWEGFCLKVLEFDPSLNLTFS